VYRAASCIHRLRREGYAIDMVREPGHVATYILIGEAAK
jgi:biotin operon repressor